MWYSIMDDLAEAAEAVVNEAVAKVGKRPDHPLRIRVPDGKVPIPDFAVDQVVRYTERFTERFCEKFVAGQREHGTHLENDHSIGQLFNHLEEELLDSWAYIQAMRAKLGI